MFQHNRKKERQRILALLTSHNEKRRLIKLLERENINSNGNDSLVNDVLTSLFLSHYMVNQNLVIIVSIIFNSDRKGPIKNISIEFVWIGIIGRVDTSREHSSEDFAPGNAVVIPWSEDHHQRQKATACWQRRRHQMGNSFGFILDGLQ